MSNPASELREAQRAVPRNPTFADEASMQIRNASFGIPEHEYRRVMIAAGVLGMNVSAFIRSSLQASIATLAENSPVVAAALAEPAPETEREAVTA